MANNYFVEIDRILDRIRSSYDEIMEHLPKAAYLKRAFEDRYLDSLKKKADIIFFLKGEQEFMERFLAEAETIKERKAAYKERNEGGFAESVLKEIQAGMAKYPLLASLHDNSIKEVSQLYGAIHQFIRDYWDGTAYYMGGISPDIGLEVDRLERSLSDVYSITESRPPKGVEFYNDMVCLDRGTKSERVRVAQDAIHLAGVWLNTLYYTLERSIDNDRQEPPEDIQTASAKLFAIIEDFRLSNFAKSQKNIKKYNR